MGPRLGKACNRSYSCVQVMQEIQSLRNELLATEGANDALLSSLEAAQERMKAIAEDADALRSEMARAREAEQAAAMEARTAYANALAATQEAATEAHRLVSASDAAHAAEIGRLTKVLW
jgi:predicted  nucleic acid-binding Zn-ribbon protein